MILEIKIFVLTKKLQNEDLSKQSNNGNCKTGMRGYKNLQF